MKVRVWLKDFPGSGLKRFEVSAAILAQAQDQENIGVINIHSENIEEEIFIFDVPNGGEQVLDALDSLGIKSEIVRR
jgi:hypothetical protein